LIVVRAAAPSRRVDGAGAFGVVPSIDDPCSRIGSVMARV
jgi:hypothetical protein